MGRVSDKVILITGGASGIGEACAQLCVKEGARVVITDVNDAAGKALATQLGDAALYLHHDVRDEAEWQKVVDAAIDRFGALDVVVNNAGIAGASNVEEETLENWRAVMAVNSDGVFLGCKLAVAAMKERGGSIINMSSIHGIKAASHALVYTATKGSVRLLTKSVALYCAEMGYPVRCNSVHPGYIMTPLLEQALERSGEAKEMYEAILARHPIGRLGTPQDVAYAVLYLASDEAAFVTGSETVVDGGYLIS